MVSAEADTHTRRFTSGRLSRPSREGSSPQLDSRARAAAALDRRVQPIWAARSTGPLIAQRISAFQNPDPDDDAARMSKYIDDPEFLQALEMATKAAQLLHSAEPNKIPESWTLSNTNAPYSPTASPSSSDGEDIGSPHHNERSPPAPPQSAAAAPTKPPKILHGMPPPPPRTGSFKCKPRCVSSGQAVPVLTTVSPAATALSAIVASSPAAASSTHAAVSSSHATASSAESLERQRSLSVGGLPATLRDAPLASAEETKSAAVAAHAEAASPNTLVRREAQAESREWLRKQVISAELTDLMDDLESSNRHNPHVAAELQPWRTALAQARRSFSKNNSFSKGGDEVGSPSGRQASDDGGEPRQGLLAESAASPIHLPSVPRLVRALPAASSADGAAPSLRRRLSLGFSWAHARHNLGEAALRSLPEHESSPSSETGTTSARESPTPYNQPPPPPPPPRRRRNQQPPAPAPLQQPAPPASAPALPLAAAPMAPAPAPASIGHLTRSMLLPPPAELPPPPPPRRRRAAQDTTMWL